MVSRGRCHWRRGSGSVCLTASLPEGVAYCGRRALVLEFLSATNRLTLLEGTFVAKSSSPATLGECRTEVRVRSTYLVLIT